MATANNNIENALSILNSFDWWWSLGNDYAYTDGTREAMENKMRKFVALAAACSDEVCKALRNLWEATYKYAHKDWMFSKATPQDKAEYEAKKEELMAIILPTSVSLAA